MKKYLTGANVQAVVLLLVSIAETVIMALFKTTGAGFVALFQIISVIGIAMLRFAPHIALIDNIIHSAFYRRNASGSYEDDEPSEIAIFFVKLAGYMLFAVQTVFMFI